MFLFGVGCRLPLAAEPLPAADPAVAPANNPADGAVAAPEPNPGPSGEGDAHFGLAPGEVAILDVHFDPSKQSGRAELRLPTGEQLSGHWSEQNSAAPREEGRLVPSSPRSDPGDPTSMPSGPPPASQLLIELIGNRGTRVQCSVPTGRRSKSKIGHCHALEADAPARGFAVRIR